MLAASSGVDVPYATIVIPITRLLIRNFLAIPTPPLTNQFPPKHNISKPMISNTELSMTSTTKCQILVV